MEIMKKTLFILLALYVGVKATAQQDPQYSMYMFNGLAINPAYAGSTEGLAANLLYRNQWTGIEGAPQTLVANVHRNFFDEKVGAGLSFINDRIGVMDRNTISLAGSYHLILEKGKLAFGLQANYSQYAVGLSSVQHNLDASVSDPTFSTNLSESTFNFGAGIFYYSDKLFGGISVPGILQNNISATEITGAEKALEIPHIFYQLGYVYAVDPMIDLKPSFLIKQVAGASLNADINLNAYYKKVIGLGLGYRTNNALVAMLECQVHPYLRLAYAYDRELTDLGTVSKHTHEVMIRFMIGQKGSQISPRLY